MRGVRHAPSNEFGEGLTDLADVVHLVVLGNGFDIDCGLPTQYGDFIDFCCLVRDLANDRDDARRSAKVDAWCDEKTASRYCLRTLLLDTFCAGGNPFEDWRPLLWGNAWLEYFEHARGKNSRRSGENWVDFEAEIARVVGQIERSMARAHATGQPLGLDDFVEVDEGDDWLDDLRWAIPQVNDEFKVVHNQSVRNGWYYSCDKTYAVLKELLVDGLKNTRLGLQKYLHDFVEKIEPRVTSGVKTLCGELARADHRYVLSFNYTHTFGTLFSKLHAAENPGTSYCYLHGEAGDDPTVCDMVLGINEEKAGKAVTEHLDFIEFRKYFQRIYNGNDTSYLSWCDELHDLAGAGAELRMFVYGHSLAQTDKDVLRRFILADGMRVTSYYYNRSAFAQQIANMVALISSDELVARTGGPDQRIQFKPQS